MRTILFFFVLVLMVVSGWFISNGNISFDSFSIAENAPASQWDSLLIGEWDYQRKVISKDKYDDYITGEGHFTFSASHTYTSYQTIKHFQFRSAKTPNLVLGGKVSGSWGIKDEYLYLNLEDCRIKVSKSVRIHVTDTTQHLIRYIGRFDDNNGTGKVRKFTTNDIVFEYKDYVNNCTETITFNRVKD